MNDITEITQSNEITDMNTTDTATTAPKRGRPATNLNLIMDRSFTLKELQALNPDVKFVTIRSAILRGIASGKFTKLATTVKTGLKGKPANIFCNAELFQNTESDINWKSSKKFAVSIDILEKADNLFSTVGTKSTEKQNTKHKTQNEHQDWFP